MNNGLSNKKSDDSPVNRKQKSRTIVSSAIRDRNGCQPDQKEKKQGNRQRQRNGYQKPGSQPMPLQKEQSKPEEWSEGRPPPSWHYKPKGPSKSQTSDLKVKSAYREGKIIVPDLMEIAHLKLDDEWEKLDRMILDVYEKNRLTEQKTQRMKALVDEMQEVLRAEWPGARLDLFGSAVNGCGSANCDLDMCFRFEEDVTEADPLTVLRKIKNILSAQYKGTRFWVINARVPIVKFKLKGMDGDISFYNDTALKNTAMFRKYCDWEPCRFPPLIMFVKRWAKDCTINCSAAGTLTSYALSLMLIHYLQQCSPPVFPFWNLDQDTRPDDYDFAEMSVISNWSRNTQSVGQLFVGFLDYYSQFDFNKLISILRKDLVDKEEKKFMDNLSSSGQVKQFPVAIEDPYLSEFNPAYSVRNKIAKIRAVFRLSREVFMGKCQILEWNESLIRMCTHFYEEGMDDFERDQLEGLREAELREKARLPPITENSMRTLAYRILKAVVCCGGAGTIAELINCYKAANKSGLNYDRKRLYGTGTLEAVFSHPILKECVTLKKTGEFKLKDGMYEEVEAVVDAVSGFRGQEEQEKMVDEGARRFLKVVRLRHEKMTPDTFLTNYLEVFSVPFNTKERKKYFGTSDMDEIVRIVSAYGLTTISTRHEQCIFDIKPVTTSPIARKLIGKLIQQITARLKENAKVENEQQNGKIVVEVTTVASNGEEISEDMIKLGVERLKQVLEKFPQNTPINRLAIGNKYRDLYNVPYSTEERHKLFGESSFQGVMLLLNNHGVEVTVESKGMYLYSIPKTAKGKKKQQNREKHPFLG